MQFSWTLFIKECNFLIFLTRILLFPKVLCTLFYANVQVQKISTLPPQKELEFPGGGGSVRPKNLKKCVKLYLNFQRGGDILEKIASMGEVWIVLGTTQFSWFIQETLGIFLW